MSDMIVANKEAVRCMVVLEKVKVDVYLSELLEFPVSPKENTYDVWSMVLYSYEPAGKNGGGRELPYY